MRYSRKLAVSACLVSCLLFWLALTPQQIAVNSAVFSGYSDQQLEMGNTYLLALLAGVAINPANILSNAAAFGSFSDRQLQEAQTYLLSQVTVGSAPIQGIIAGANMTGSTNGTVVTLTSTASSGSGLPGTNTVIAYGGDPATAAQTNWSAEANGGWYETNKSGAVNIASNGVFSATGPSGVNGSLTLNDSSGAVELTATNGGIWTKANVEYGINTTTSFTPQINMLLEDQLFVSATNFSIAVANVPTASTRYSTMTISNSGNNASTILVTLTGFCAFTNGSTVATSTFYVTNVTAKNQVAELNVRCRANGLTNGIVTHLYDK